MTGNLTGTLEDLNGKQITRQGRWDITFGNGGAAFSKIVLYFTTGITGPEQIEDRGLLPASSQLSSPIHDPVRQPTRKLDRLRLA
jgi:hypothetical protein